MKLNEESEREFENFKCIPAKGGALAALSVQRLGYGLGGACGVTVPIGASEFSIPQNVPTSSGAQTRRMFNV